MPRVSSRALHGVPARVWPWPNSSSGDTGAVARFFDTTAGGGVAVVAVVVEVEVVAPWSPACAGNTPIARRTTAAAAAETIPSFLIIIGTRRWSVVAGRDRSSAQRTPKQRYLGAGSVQIW